MPQNVWTGLLGHIGKPTDTGRTIELLHVDEHPLPLLHADAGVIGRIEATELRIDGSFHGHGVTDLDPGEYPVGMDVGYVHPGRRNREHVRGQLLGATVGRGHAGWADATITVIAP